MKVRRGSNRFGVWQIQIRDQDANKRFCASLDTIPVVDDNDWSKTISYIWSFEFWFYRWGLIFDLHGYKKEV